MEQGIQETVPVVVKQPEHHKYGPSALDALSQCVRFLYNDSDQEAGDEGTELHHAFETNDLTGLDDEQKKSVSSITNYVEALKYSEGTSPADWDDYKEMRLTLDGLTFGKGDRILHCKRLRIAHVIDAKFTRISKEHSMQLRSYGAAFAEQHPGEVDTVVTHVVAPRTRDIETNSYLAATLISEIRRDIVTLYERIEDPFTPPTPCEDLCAKCARAGRCPALGNVMVTLCKGIGLPLPSEFNPTAEVSLLNRAIWQVMAGAAINWGEQVKKANSAFVFSSDIDIPGHKRMRRSNGLRIPKERTLEAVNMLLGSFGGLTLDRLLSCCSLTLGDAVSAISSLTGLPEAVTKERVREILATVGTESVSEFLMKDKKVSDEVLLLQLQSSM